MREDARQPGPLGSVTTCVRTPRPMMQSHEDGISSVAMISLIALGLGCYLGWQTIDISPTLFPTPAPGVSPVLDRWAYVGTILLITLLALFAALTWKRGSLLRYRWLIALGALGPSAGTAILYISGWTSDDPLLAGVAAGRVLYGMSAAFVVLWGELLCRTKPSHTLACVAAGYGISFGFCLIEANLTPLAALTFRPILPLISGVILLALRHDLMSSVGARSIMDMASTPPLRAGKPPLRLFLGTGLFGAIFVATNHLSETKTEVSTELFTLIAGIGISIALVLIAMATKGMHENFSLLYRLITPLVIGCLLLTLVLQPGRQYYEALAIGLTWAFFRIFTWTLWGRMGACDPMRGACVFALGQICLTICSSIGEYICSIVNLEAVPLAAAASSIILAAVFASAFVMNEGSIARLLSARGAGASGAEPVTLNNALGAGEPLGGALAGMPGAPAVGTAPATGGTQGTSAAVTVFQLDVDAVTLEQLSRAVHDLGLSEREREISLLVLKRHDNGCICQEACITESTLRTHLRNIYGKTDTHSRSELIELMESRLMG